MNTVRNQRILLVDDMPAIHADFRKILGPRQGNTAELSAVEAALFGDAPKVGAVGFELDSAYQGEEALAKVRASLAAGLPYAMAFVDMRMPPGWDGVQTIEQLWQVDPKLQVVICTAFSDHSWDEVRAQLDVRDRLLILKKPFDSIEVLQLAATLTAKWDSAQQAAAQLLHLEDAVLQRTHQIGRANEALQLEISERKNLEAQLIQSEKLASIGQLAAGVAHEINNPIGYIFSNFATLEGYLESLFEMLQAYETAEKCVAAPQMQAELRVLRERIELEFLKEDIPVLMRESKEGVVRVRQIVQDLKDFARVDANNEWQWADLHAGIDATLNIVANEIKYKADVLKEYGEIPYVECLPSQVNQVVMNLVVNAAHAMGERRGRITIRTGTEADQVWLEVADTGSGIDPQTLPRIFDPFFTTKPVGKGTGLGLSLAYGIVQKHHGHIAVDSAVGEGTKFRVTLPVRQAATQEEKAAASV